MCIRDRFVDNPLWKALCSWLESVTGIISQRLPLSGLAVWYSCRTGGEQRGSSASAAMASRWPMHTRQVNEPAAGYKVHSARPPFLYFTFQRCV